MTLILRLCKRVRRAMAKVGLKHKHYCIVCGKGFNKFLPFNGAKLTEQFINALDVVGSDMKNFSCPYCMSHDRERHLYLYMLETGLYRHFTGKKILHFAPERHLSKKVFEQGPSRYIKADIEPTESDTIKMDIHQIPFEDEYFDFIICNHVLEHVDDYKKALREVRRVLCKGGYAILQTPYSKKLNKTFCDEGLSDDISRLFVYGQKDHLRLFGNDIFDCISKCGLTNKVVAHETLLSQYESSKYGVNSEEPFFLFQRPI
jgi:SAM-dependent methyltransferase